MAHFVLSGPTRKPPTSTKSLGEVYLTRFENHADRMAIMQQVEGLDVSLSYVELTRRGKLVSCLLRDQGIEAGDTVMLLCGNTLEHAPIMLGTLLSGASLAPVNQAFDTNDMLHSIKIIKPKIIISNKYAETCVKDALTMYEREVPFITIDTLSEYWKNNSSPDEFKLGLVEDVTSHVALVMCSSGSTGKPKGVELTHFNLLSLLQGNPFPVADPREEMITLNLSGPFWITGQIITMFSLCLGYKLVLLEKFSAEKFFCTVEHFKIKTGLLNPEQMGAIAQYQSTEHFDLSSLHTMLYGGSSVSQSMLELTERNLRCPLSNWYGLTECEGQLMPMYGALNKRGSVGKLGVNTLAKVIDPESGQLLGPHSKGELCFRAPMSFMSYRGAPESTRDVYDEEGFLHSGDIGFYDEDEYFFVVDRIKDMFKYNGIHICGIEIEEVLLRHPAVFETAVVGIPHEVDCARSTAFVVLRQHGSATEQELLALVQDELPPYKWLYGGVVFVAALPKSATGKVQKNVLKNAWSKSKSSLSPTKQADDNV